MIEPQEKRLDEDDSIVIDLKDVVKTFDAGFSKVNALRGVSVRVFSKDFIIIFGPSGCGKSTLMNVILGLEKPDSGKVFVRGTEIYGLGEDERADFRANRVGVVYQQPTWVKSLTVLDNVAFPLLLKGLSLRSARVIAEKKLIEVGMHELRDRVPTELSGGQQQKVSFARALVNNPWMMLLDEPTGNLDSAAGDDLIRSLVRINKEGKRTIVMVTHNIAYLLRASKVVSMKDGTVEGEYSGQEIQKFIRNQIMGLK